jgi:hypothetical protein
VGFVGASRRSELASLERPLVAPDPKNSLITIPRSKTDPYGKGPGGRPSVREPLGSLSGHLPAGLVTRICLSQDPEHRRFPPQSPQLRRPARRSASTTPTKRPYSASLSVGTPPATTGHPRRSHPYRDFPRRCSPRAACLLVGQPTLCPAHQARELRRSRPANRPSLRRSDIPVGYSSHRVRATRRIIGQPAPCSCPSNSLETRRPPVIGRLPVASTQQ